MASRPRKVIKPRPAPLGERNKPLLEVVPADPVNLPPHYKQFGEMEPIRVGVMRYGVGVLKAKIDKYISRAEMKNGIQDIDKAIRCAQMLKEYLKGNPDWWR